MNRHNNNNSFFREKNNKYNTYKENRSYQDFKSSKKPKDIDTNNSDDFPELSNCRETTVKSSNLKYNTLTYEDEMPKETMIDYRGWIMLEYDSKSKCILQSPAPSVNNEVQSQETSYLYHLRASSAINDIIHNHEIAREEFINLHGEEYYERQYCMSLEFYEDALRYEEDDGTDDYEINVDTFFEEEDEYLDDNDYP
jgi:hypothetical protein